LGNMISTAKTGPGGKKTQGILLGFNWVGKPPAPKSPRHRNHGKGKKQKMYTAPPCNGANKLDITEKEGGEQELDGGT
jgi:hypothetical protein